MKYRKRINYKVASMVSVLIIFILGIGLSLLPHFTRNTYEVKVTEKQIKRSDDSDKYLIYTELKDDNIRVFENTDSLYERKFDSSNLWAKIKENKTYEIKTYGWRIPFLSVYENIVDIQEIK